MSSLYAPPGALVLRSSFSRHQTSQSSLASSSASTLPDRCSLLGLGAAGDSSDIEKYAKDNLNLHKRGIFRKKNTVRDMLSWSKVGVTAKRANHVGAGVARNVNMRTEAYQDAESPKIVLLRTNQWNPTPMEFCC